MTKKITFLKWLFLAVAVGMSGNVFSQNPSNGGFENGSTGWTLVTTTNSTGSVASDGNARTGSSYLKVYQTALDGTTARVQNSLDQMSILTDQYVHIIAWVKNTVSSGGTFALGMEGDYYFRPGNNTGGSGGVIPATSYTRYTTSNRKSTKDATNEKTSLRTWTYESNTTWPNSICIDDVITYFDFNAASDLVKPETATNLTNISTTSSLISFSWTNGTDALTGIQGTLILRTTNTSASAPELNDQAVYSVAGGTAGPNTIGDWTVLSTSVGAATTTYTDNTCAASTSYKYAVVHRDMAYNYSDALVSETITTSATNSINVVSGTSSNSALTVCPTCDLVVNNGAELTVDVDRTYNSLTVAAGGKVTNDNATSTTLTITNNLTLESSAGNGTGTYVEKQSGALSVGGTTTVQQYLATATGGRNYFISSPVASATSNVVKSEALNKLWSYTEANSGTVLWNEITATNTPLTVMAGYVAKLNAAGNISFTGGALNTGSKTSPTLTNIGTVSTGFNLVGNPYPSYVNWDAATKTNVSTSIWYRSKSTGSYLFQTYNVTGAGVGANGGSALIPPMQSFWVKATGADASVTFENSMRSHQDQSVATNRLKTKAVSNQQLVRLQVSANNISDEAVIYFNENASNDLDMYDSEKMWNNVASAPEIYTIINNKELVISGMKSIEDVQSLDLGFKTGQTNTFSIKATEVTNMDANTRIILKDNQEKTEIDITEGAAYSFTSDAVNTASRFSLVFRAPSITSGLAAPQLSMSIVHNANNQLIVNSGASEKGQINIFNALGQKVKALPTTGNSTLIGHQFESGVYILTLEVGTLKATQKIIIN